MLEPVIKWSGSKRSQAEIILKEFPKKIKTYYEPFTGGSSVMFALLHSDIEFERIICSDLNSDLIDLWNMIKNNKECLINGYREHWEELNKDENEDRRKSYYNKIREQFNEHKNPVDFIFINRTATNGLVRYNKKGEFNNSFHFSRKGILPSNLEKIINEWSALLNLHNIEFICCDFTLIHGEEGDFIYADPPYEKTKGIYYGDIDYEIFYEWLRSQDCEYCFSFNGKCENQDNTVDIPQDVYTKHMYITSGCSSFRRLVDNKIAYVEESLYIKHKSRD